MSKSKVTIYDVSHRLGVSTATVNRVLNNKPNVSEKTRKRVMDAVEEMGYRPSRAASSLSRTPVRLALISCIPIQEFSDEVTRGAQRSFDELSDFGLIGEFVYVDGSSSINEFLNAMYDCAAKGFDAILLIPPKEEDIVKDAMEDIARNGIKFGVGVSGINSKCNCINVMRNGVVAGSMAAEMLSVMLDPGDKVAMVTGNRNTSVHTTTVEGFEKFVTASDLEYVGLYEHRDDPQLGAWVAERIVRDHPDIKGLYLGTANEVTLINKLIELGCGGRIKIVSSDIFPAINTFMEEGVVQASIFQDPYRLGKLLVRYMFELLAEGKKIENREVLLDPHIVLNSNKGLFLERSGYLEENPGER